MGRPPSNGGPSFRFNPAEIAEMEAILQAHKTAMPAREVLVTLAEKFSNSEERKGKIEVQMKQVWNWFQNRRYAIRAKAGKSPGKLNMTQLTRDDPTMVKGIPQPTLPHAASSATVRYMPHPTVPSDAVRTFPQAPQNTMSFSVVQSAGRVADNSQMEYEAKSARDGAWYDVSTFLSHRSLDPADPEVMVRFAGFGAEEDEWVNVRKNVRQRSLPCEASECVAVLPADLILCFQEGKEQALYFDAHVLDAQRRRHDVRGCRCRFLVRYDHDQSEEIVALRKICRRPETDYRLQQLHAVNESLSVNHNKNGTHTLRVYPPAEVQPKQLKVDPTVAEAPPKRQKVESTVPAPPPETPTVLVAQPGNVPQDQQNVQPAPSPEVTQDQHHKIEPVLPAPPSLDPVPTDEVPLKVQPVMPGEVSGESRAAAGPLVPPVAASEPPQEGKSEPQEEPMVCSSWVESPQVQSASAIESKAEVQTQLPLEAVETKADVPAELHEVQQPPSALETKAEVLPELPQVQPVEMKDEVQAELPQVQSANEAEVQTELPQVQSASAVESKADVQTELVEIQPEALQTKAEVPAELLEVQPSIAIETKAEVPPELPQVQPPRAIETVEMKAEVQAESPEAQPVEAIKMKADVPEELPQVQPANSLETKAEVPAQVPGVQPATASVLEAIESKAEVPVQVQPAGAGVVEAMDTKVEVSEELPDASALMETEGEVPKELAELEAASAVMETEAEEPVVAVCTNDSNVVEEAMEMEAEIEQPKVSQINDGNDHDMEEEV